MTISFSDEELAPIIERAVAFTVARLEATTSKLGDQLAFSEAQAAALLGVKRHVLRDARLRGEVEASRLGQQVVYSRETLLDLMRRNRI